MISRREFLIGVGSGLVLPRFFDRALALYENHSEALLEAPATANTIITASMRYSDSFQLLLGDPAEEPPSLTLLEYIERYTPWVKDDEAEEEYGMALEQEVPDWMVFDNWCRQDSPNALAYHLLDSYDLGSLRNHGEGKVGEIEFIDGPCPGNDYLGVEAATELDLSLLQDQLNQIEARIRIEIG